MKYLVLLVVLVVAIGIWRSRRAEDSEARPQRQPAPPGRPQDVLACAHCGVHVPQADALMLGSEAYCSAEHRRLGPA